MQTQKIPPRLCLPGTGHSFKKDPRYHPHSRHTVVDVCLIDKQSKREKRALIPVNARYTQDGYLPRSGMPCEAWSIQPCSPSVLREVFRSSIAGKLAAVASLSVDLGSNYFVPSKNRKY